MKHIKIQTGAELCQALDKDGKATNKDEERKNPNIISNKLIVI